MLGSLRCLRSPFWWGVQLGRLGVGLASMIGPLLVPRDDDFDSYDSLASP